MNITKYANPATRAYSVLTVKSGTEDGTIVGVASSIETDRAGDVLLPEGAKFRLPIPLLWQHDHSQPIGQVTSAKVNSRGIEIVAKIALGVDEAIDRSYRLIQAGLVRGLSVGFRGLEYEPIATGIKFRSWELLELSAVTLPCNAACTIQSVKSACKASAGAIALINTHRGAVKLSGGDSIKLSRQSVRLTLPYIRLSPSKRATPHALPYVKLVSR